MSADQDRSPNERMQLTVLYVHGAVVALVVICTLALTFTGKIASDGAVGLLGTALGFSGSTAANRVGYRGGFQAGVVNGGRH